MLHYKTYIKGDNHPWVTFIHGAGGSSSVWFKQIKEFRKAHNVLLLDLRGHGRSERGRWKKGDSFREVADDVVEVMDKLGISRSHMIGMSLGTIVAQTLAERHPGRVKSLILGGAVIGLDIRTEESRLAFVNQAKKMCQKEFVKWFSLTKLINPYLARLQSTTTCVPTLFLMGEEDYLFIPPVEEVVGRSEKFRLITIRNSGHVCNIDQPDEFNRHSIRYIREMESALGVA